MIGLADIYKAVGACWNEAELDGQFTSRWSVADRSEFTVLNDSTAEASQPFPYCVLSMEEGKTIQGMTGNSIGQRREVREIPTKFTVHAKSASGSSAKAIAATLVEEIVKVFGGHPTQPSRIHDHVLDNGGVLNCKYVSEYQVRTDTEACSWVVRYMMVVDVPVWVGNL